MVRIALVEDDPVFLSQMQEYLERYFRETERRYAVTCFQDGLDIAEEYRGEFDLILMDIQMKHLDGMKTAEYIRRMDEKVVIIFITSLASYAVRGYAVDALDYILKPLSYYAFCQSLRRALERIARRSRRYVAITHRNGMKRLECGQIYYVEVDGRGLIWHTADGDYPVSGSMKEAESLLTGCPFFRCNKGYLVNLEHVEGMRGDDALVHGVPLQVSRSKKKAFLDAVNRYINEVEP